MGSYDEAYLDRVADVVARAAAHEMYVLIDFHQDGWSKYLGEDGAPLWATHGDTGPVDPALLLCGPLEGTLDERRISPATGAAFRAFFGPESRSREALQNAFIAMVTHVAARFEPEPYVLGLEVFNEPVFDDRTLRMFHERVATEIHARVRP